jgi:hypothetical protein
MKICINPKKIHISEHPIGYKFHHSDQRKLCGLFVWIGVRFRGVSVSGSTVSAGVDRSEI